MKRFLKRRLPALMLSAVLTLSLMPTALAADCEMCIRDSCDTEGTISDNDSVIFFNYRPDRAREITRALVDPAFDGFTRQIFPLPFVCNTEYDATMPNVEVAFPRITVKNGLGEYLSQMGMTQLRIAETEKYAHVTFFFNGGCETVFPGEDRVLVASPKVATRCV